MAQMESRVTEIQNNLIKLSTLLPPNLAISTDDLPEFPMQMVNQILDFEVKLKSDTILRSAVVRIFF